MRGSASQVRPMFFNSIQYVVLLATVVAAFWLLRGRRNARVLVLLAASYLFYAAWDWRFTGLLALSTVVDYFVGRGLAHTDDQPKRKRLLQLSLLVNLGVLGFFKYFNFFVDTAAAFLDSLGLSASMPTLQIILPVGISFYTFQTLAYTIDCYYRRIEPTRDFLAFATYVAFFPQLVAGPIERAGRLLPQLEQPAERLSGEDVRTGLALILLGLFKKVAIADAVAPFVDSIYRAPGEASWIGIAGATYAFALQIYADFSGYSDIARGSARLVGVELVRNFEQPYLSRNITEFWRTWHISLSKWLRDYLYIPLGGNRKGPRRTLINLFVTMLLGGLWHGAAWTFVLWGGLHGAYLAVHRLWRHHAGDATFRLPRFDELWRVVLTFHFVCLGWVFFRADGFSTALELLGRVATLASGPFPGNELALLVAGGAATIAIDVAQRQSGHHVPHVVRPVVHGALAGVTAAAILLFAGQPGVPFLYFQF